MGALLQDLRFAFRMLAKNPGFTIVAVLTLGLGIGANSAIFSVVQNVLLRPLPYQHPESLAQIWNTYLPVYPRVGLSQGDYEDWGRQARTVSEFGAYVDVSQGFNLTGGGDPERVESSYATANLFPMLGIRMAVGRGFVPAEDKPGSAPAVILSHRFWQSRFGADAAAVGRTLTLDGQRYTIIGALPANFALLQWPDLWMPVGQYPNDLVEVHIHHPYSVIARMKPSVSAGQVQAEMATLNRQSAIAFPVAHKNFGVGAERLEDPTAARLRRTLLVLFGVVGLVLLIACANIVNLLLARNAVREKEMALRTALGASEWRLIRQLLTESVLLSLAGGALGLGLAGAGLKILGTMVPANLAIAQASGLNGWVLGFTIAVCLVAGLACGFVPALQSLTRNLNGVLKQGSRGSGPASSRRVLSPLVVSEIAMALVALIGAGLLLRSLHHLLGVDSGFRTDHILTMEISQAPLPEAELLKLSDEQQRELAKKEALAFEQIVERVRTLPGVKSAGGIDYLPLGSGEARHASRFVIEGRPIPEAGVLQLVLVRTVTLGYFSAVGIPLLRGRTFEPEDRGLERIVINRSMARRFWANEDPLNKRINLCSVVPTPCWYSIIGVVGDVHQAGLDGAPTDDAYFTGGWTPQLVMRTSSDPIGLAAAVTDVVHKSDPALPVKHVTTMEALLADSVSPRRFAAVLIGIFAGLALLLATVGIYGAMSYTVSQRTQEIGIRVALGAQPAHVRGLILGGTMRMAIFGVVIGLGGGLVLGRFLSSMLFDVKAYDPVTFAGVAATFICIALGASYLPARRAMRVDPMVALRYE